MAYASVHAATLGTKTVPILSAGLAMQYQLTSEAPVGDPHIRLQAIVSASTNPTLSTRWIGTVLPEIGCDGVSLATKGLTLFSKTWTASGTWGSNLSAVVAAGIMYPTSLRCDHQGDATLDVAAIAISADDSDPWTHGTTAATVADDDERWTLPATIEIGGVEVGQIQSIEIDFGITVETDGSGSAAWPQIAHIVERKPMVTVTTSDLSYISTYETDLAVIGDFECIFRNRADGGIFGAETLTLSGNGVSWPGQVVSGSGRKAATMQIITELRGVSTTSPLVAAYDDGVE